MWQSNFAGFFDIFRIKKCGKVILLQSVTDCYCKVRQVLQSVTNLLQSASGTTQRDSYYKVRRNIFYHRKNCSTEKITETSQKLWRDHLVIEDDLWCCYKRFQNTAYKIKAINICWHNIYLTLAIIVSFFQTHVQK